MEMFEKEIAALTALSAQQSAQSELVLQRLAELAETRKAEALKEAPASAPASAPVEPTPTQAQDTESFMATNVFPAGRKAGVVPANLFGDEAATPPIKKPERTESPAPAAAPPAPREAAPAPRKAAPAPREPEAKAEPAATAVTEAAPQTPFAPEPESPAPTPAEPSKPRKGPVWPV
jgi:hypothetical protein